MRDGNDPMVLSGQCLGSLSQSDPAILSHPKTGSVLKADADAQSIQTPG
jgi:hypothetical protein